MNPCYLNRSGVLGAMYRSYKCAGHRFLVCAAIGLLITLFISPFAAAQQSKYSSPEFRRVLDRAWHAYIKPTGVSLKNFIEQRPLDFAVTMGYAVRKEFPGMTDIQQMQKRYPVLDSELFSLVGDVSNMAVNSPPPYVLWSHMLDAMAGRYDQHFQSSQAARPGQRGYGSSPPPKSPKLIRKEDNNSITLLGKSAPGVRGLPSNAPAGDISPNMIAGTWIERNYKDRLVVQSQGNNKFVGKIVGIGKPSNYEYSDRSVLLNRMYVFTFSGFGRSASTNGKAAVFAVKQQSAMPQSRNKWYNKKAAIFFRRDLLEMDIGCAMTGEHWQRGGR